MQKVNEIFGFLSPKQLTTLDNKTLREKASTLRNLYRDDLDKDELSVEIENFKYTVVSSDNLAGNESKKRGMQCVKPSSAVQTSSCIPRPKRYQSLLTNDPRTWIESPGNGRRPLPETAVDGCQNGNDMTPDLDGWSQVR
ncbi:hypothetical protein AVEN_126374-1 [Araneus ventricosus]|uniref:Uncharacterized protein n=1 Tax=Araneus ventricosus TaxID=182803 RepID=A0A4Y2FVD3_ARAVE|nr:hypothetical protein AVEN_126374-1 [Araneus ventricosus]